MDPALAESTFSVFITGLVIIVVFGGIAVAGTFIEQLINENERLEEENKKLRKGKVI
ncbi:MULTISPECIES: hypothetical protein [Bacillus cereus group]|uniref:hypothetical protein n=1 Tax=Bacillus cereus group TaxID=86661 RepID=UPI000863CE63|nr:MULTISPECIES: hypothetical protein [Bacillus cereus group]MDH2858872.1 hypothetical protein [Bacillus cytotoxicus]MDH2871355.1 hypothetical protein [Bacillus cytotoxicus]MDH2874860.1 hypothetical protein [Bacillus cytotoxicus]MDH2878945.1 hypothetical protein [Bacillus cytotoxicus]MDH2887431.1 hypothetical protein [Bacillus cytotoxicus]